ncbi:DUF2590 family protein, partial [Escherichia coli]
MDCQTCANTWPTCSATDITQDIIHSILESGITTRLIGERSPT